MKGEFERKDSYRSIFTNKHVILPVIHVESDEQALRNAGIAHEAGCDGVFLINHGFPYRQLLDIQHQVCEALPGWWVGVNCLDLYPRQVFPVLTEKVAGVWVDNAGIDERAEEQTEAEEIRLEREKCDWPGLYFGGVAF